MTHQHLDFAALESFSEQMQDDVFLEVDLFSFSVCFNSLSKPCIVDTESSISCCIVCDESAKDGFSSRGSSDSVQL